MFCRRTGQCFSVLRTLHTDVVDSSSGRSYVTEQWHNVPLLRTRALVTGAANAGDLNVCCGVLVVAGNCTFSDVSSYAKPNRLDPHYKLSEFVIGNWTHPVYMVQYVFNFSCITPSWSALMFTASSWGEILKLYLTVRQARKWRNTLRQRFSIGGPQYS